MVYRLDQSEKGFEAAFAAFLSTKREVSADVDAVVKEIIADVRTRGDEAVLELTNRFDRVDFTASDLRVSEEEISAAESSIAPETMDALRVAFDRIKTYHKRQIPDDDQFTDETGTELGHRWNAVESAGMYVPGGTAAYPSSVLMNAVPARVAGVKRLVMTVPSPDGYLNPLVLAAARLAGVDEVYRIGGAQAIAALAYGTETVSPVVKIVGPGNAYVAAAKRQVFGQVGIDMVAGPSEVLIVADDNNDPDWIAADLLAQAEHDTASQSILITTSRALAKSVPAALEHQLETLPRKEIARQSWDEFGAIILVETLKDAVPLIDRIAPEHFEVALDDPDSFAGQVRNAGAIFLGRFTPEAIGDFVAGSNHILPTARSARFASGLGVLDFLKRTSILKCSQSGLRKIGPVAMILGEVEGLQAHVNSIKIRL